jgi:hypothetical protein
MATQSFDILCPECRSIVPPEASGCPNCAERRKPAPAAVGVVPAPRPPKAPDVGGMPLKDYHRFVRTNHRTVEGHRVAGHAGGGVAFLTYLPLALLFLGMVVGAVLLASGRLH